MSKRNRIIQLTKMLSENKEGIKQAVYGAEFALKTREYSHLLRCAQRLINHDSLIQEIEMELEDLNKPSDENGDDDTGVLGF